METIIIAWQYFDNIIYSNHTSSESETYFIVRSIHGMYILKKVNSRPRDNVFWFSVEHYTRHG